MFEHHWRLNITDHVSSGKFGKSVTNTVIRHATLILHPALNWARLLSISHGFKVNRNGPCLQKITI